MPPPSDTARPRRPSSGPRPGAAARAALVVLALAAGLGAAPSASAEAGSRSEAIEQALSRSGGGKVLGVTESVGADGRKEYAVKVLTDGRVRVVRIRGR